MQPHSTRRCLFSLLACAVFLVTPALAHEEGVVEITMRQVDGAYFFDPVGVHVQPGTTVRFVLIDGVHDTQAFHPDNEASGGSLRIPPEATPWNSGMMGGIGGLPTTFDVTLSDEGVYDYFCSPHLALGMVGRIVVGDPDAAPAAPTAALEHEAARAVLPTVEEIVEHGVVRLEIASIEPPVRSGDEVLSRLDADDRLGYWFGGDSTVTDWFDAAGTWELYLSAYCFDGVGFVSVVVRDASHRAVGQAQVIGQGIDNVLVTTPPGRYYLDVFVSVAHIYSWEVVAVPLHAASDGHVP